MRLRPGDDYPSGLMALRPRFRRMICFLNRHGLVGVARELEKATGVFFDAHHMNHLLTMGLCEEAKDYLQHFTPTAKNNRILAAGGPKDDADLLAATTSDDERSPHFARLQEILHKILADEPRPLVGRKMIAPDVVNTVMELVTNCPELKSKLQELPRNKPWEVNPLVGARGSQRRRRRSSRAVGCTTAHSLSRVFLLKQKRLHSIQEKNAHSDQQQGYVGEYGSTGTALEKQDNAQP